MARKRNKNWVDTKELENIFAKILKKRIVDEETLKLKEEFIERFKQMIRSIR